MSLKEELICVLECLSIVLFFSYFFYRSIFPVVSIIIVFPFYRRYKKKYLSKKRIKALTLQFREMLNSLAGAISAGYSLENAVSEACKDMKELYGSSSYIVRELVSIETGLRNNQSIEKLFLLFGIRSSVEDIDQFAGVIAIGKRYGGNLNETMEEAISTIDEKISVEQEIDSMLKAKVYELKVMELVPFAIILYIEITSRNYFKNLYHTTVGVVIMTICMVLYLFAVYLAEKIIHIQV